MIRISSSLLVVTRDTAEATGQRDPAEATARVIATAFCGMAVTIAFGRFSLGLLLPGMKESFDQGYAALGSLASLNLAGYVLGVFAIPRLARKVPHLRLVRWGLYLATAGMLAAALAPGLGVLAVAVTLTGVAGAFGWVSGAASAVEVSGSRNRGRLLGIVALANGVGLVVAAGMAALVVDSGVADGWRLVWLGQGLLGAAGCLVALSTPIDRSRLAVGRGRVRLRGLTILAVGYGCFGLGAAWFTTYYIAGASAQGQISQPLAWAAMGVGTIAGGACLGSAGDRWGHRPILGLNQLSACAAAAIMATNASDQAFVVVAGFLFGTVMSGLSALLPALLATAVSPAQVGDAFAGLTVVLAFAQVVAPPIGGLVLDQSAHGFTLLFTAAAVAFLASSLAFLGHRSRLTPEPY
jgi:MFS family permease